MPTPSWPTLLALKRDMELWLDSHDLALRIQARPRLVPIYLRFFPDLREVGTTPSLLSNETVTTLDRTPGTATAERCCGQRRDASHGQGVAALRAGDVLRRRPVGRQAPRSSGPSPAG